jgi:nucleoside-diphosphate-sugar epimerase
VISYDLQTIPPEEGLKGMTEVVGDIRDEKRLYESMQGAQYVIHCAAALALATPEEIHEVNAEGTKKVIEAAKKAHAKKMVYISTTAVYGMPKFHPLYEDSKRDPMGPYGIAKGKAEDYCLNENNLDISIIRPKSFIGTGRLGIFQILFDWIECGKAIYILGNGENKFQLLEVTDLAEAIYLAALKGKSKVYNIGASQFGTVNEDVNALLKAANTGSKIRHIPSAPAKFILRVLEVLHLSPIYRWVYDTADQDSFVSTTLAQNELGWNPKNSNQDALIKTYQWYLKEGKKMALQTGTSHRVAWKQGLLRVLKFLS